jgi:hypothetical protein
VPRAHSIHIVQDGMLDGEPVASFTVKKELDAWLELNPGMTDDGQPWPNRFVVVRLVDGGRDWKVRWRALGRT